MTRAEAMERALGDCAEAISDCLLDNGGRARCVEHHTRLPCFAAEAKKAARAALALPPDDKDAEIARLKSLLQQKDSVMQAEYDRQIERLKAERDAWKAVAEAFASRDPITAVERMFVARALEEKP